MAGDPRQLGGDHPQVLGPLGDLDFDHVLDRDHVGVVAGHRRQVVEAIGVDHILLVVHALGDLLGAAVQVAQHRSALVDDLAVGPPGLLPRGQGQAAEEHSAQGEIVHRRRRQVRCQDLVPGRGVRCLRRRPDRCWIWPAAVDAPASGWPSADTA